jgi:NitT/TauT family transport system substrate-binding protein
MRAGPSRAAAIAAFAAAGVTMSAAPRPASAQADLPLIRLGTGSDNATTPILYAISSGLYKKVGIAVETDLVGSGAAAAAAVAGGSLDVGKTSAIGCIAMIAKGLPFTAIGALGHYDSARPVYALLVPSDSAIRVPKDLEGKTFASLSLFDQNSIATQMWLDAHGVDRSTVKYVEIPPSAALAAMEQKRIDAATVYEPFLSAMLASGKARVIAYPMDAIAKRFPDTLMFANAAWVAAHKDLVDKFLRATAEASTYVAAHEAETSALLAAFVKADPATLTGQRYPARGVALTPADLQPVIDAAATFKAIPKSFPAQDMIYAGALKKNP